MYYRGSSHLLRIRTSRSLAIRAPKLLGSYAINRERIVLFGGGTLFGSLAVAGLVDTVEVGIFPVLLGGGKKLMAGCPHRIKLELLSLEQNVMGCVAMKYIVVRS
jgi:dihydrofolate reductase